MPLEFHLRAKKVLEQNGGLLKILNVSVQVSYISTRILQDLSVVDTIGTARLKSPAEVILYELSIGPVALQSYISVAVD